MEVQPEAEEKKAWTVKNDPRVTGIGKFMRRTSIDELPQLFNILQGRYESGGTTVPRAPFFVEKFREEIPRYMVKHQVRPGLTGWAQVNGYRGDTSIKKRIDCDLYYIENWSIGFDIKILFLTIFKGFRKQKRILKSKGRKDGKTKKEIQNQKDTFCSRNHSASCVYRRSVCIWTAYVPNGQDQIAQKLDTEKIQVNEEVQDAINSEDSHLTGYTTYALFGIDSRSANMKFSGNQNSDTMIIASVNNDTKEVRLVSVYRDTLLNLGDDTYSKANAAYAYGGPEQAITMLNTNLDLNITDYATVKLRCTCNDY